MRQISGTMFEHELKTEKKFQDILLDYSHQAISEVISKACIGEEDASSNLFLHIIIDAILLTGNAEQRSENIRFEDFPGTLEYHFQRINELNEVKNVGHTIIL